MRLTNWTDAFLDRQHRCPSGIAGRMVGERMVRQHEPETNWTIALLEIAPTDRVLEIGCGAGSAVELIAAQAAQGYVAGIDLSRAMVRASRRRNARSINAGKVEVRQADVASLPFADYQFDKVLSIHCLYFWPNPLHDLAEIGRVLKPGGLLALTLSPGKVGAVIDTGYLGIVKEQVIPEMKRLGFTSAYLKDGPNSRQFRTIAVIGVR